MTIYTFYYFNFRMEYVHWTARSFRAKVLGMILMVSGGCIVGFYHGSSISIMHSHTGNRIGRTARDLVEDWFRGPVLVLVALAASVWYNLQIVSFIFTEKVIFFFTVIVYKICYYI